MKITQEVDYAIRICAELAQALTLRRIIETIDGVIAIQMTIIAVIGVNKGNASFIVCLKNLTA